MTTYLEHRRALKLSGPQPKQKKIYKIKPFSDKRTKLNREYAKESGPRWKGLPCGIRSKVCTGRAQGMHHPGGKGTPELLLDPNNQIPCCNPCNQFLEQHDAWARGRGFKVSRLKK